MCMYACTHARAHTHTSHTHTHTRTHTDSMFDMQSGSCGKCKIVLAASPAHQLPQQTNPGHPNTCKAYCEYYGHACTGTWTLEGEGCREGDELTCETSLVNAGGVCRCGDALPDKVFNHPFAKAREGSKYGSMTNSTALPPTSMCLFAGPAGPWTREGLRALFSSLDEFAQDYSTFDEALRYVF